MLPKEREEGYRKPQNDQSIKEERDRRDERIDRDEERRDRTIRERDRNERER